MLEVSANQVTAQERRDYTKKWVGCALITSAILTIAAVACIFQKKYSLSKPVSIGCRVVAPLGFFTTLTLSGILVKWPQTKERGLIIAS